jgi:site-specific recombinase XerD
MRPDNLLKRFQSARELMGRSSGGTLPRSLATNLQGMGVDVKMAQELLRHANIRTMLDI